MKQHFVEPTWVHATVHDGYFLTQVFSGEINKDVSMVFIDFEKAYHKVPREVMSGFWKERVPPRYIDLLKDVVDGVVQLV